jgi:hypothetical protein
MITRFSGWQRAELKSPATTTSPVQCFVRSSRSPTSFQRSRPVRRNGPSPLVALLVKCRQTTRSGRPAQSIVPETT